MKSISKYLAENIYNIFESAFNIAPGDANKCKQYFDNHIKTTHRKGSQIPLEVFEYIFDLWKNKFNSDPKHIPFRCNDTHAKLSRLYLPLASSIIKYCSQQLNINASIYKTKHDIYLNISDVNIQFGDGSLGKVRAGNGLQYEDVILEEIISFIQLVADDHKPNEKLSIKKLNNIFKNNEYMNRWFNCYLQGGFDELLNIYINNPNIDLYTYVTKTGSSNIRRNDKNQLFDNEFNITLSDIQSVLIDSGRIISDITISGPGIKNPQYFSVKMKDSQLSGCNYRQAMTDNIVFQNFVRNNENWNNVRRNKCMNPFINFCKTLGLRAQSVFNQYKAIYNDHNLINNGQIDLLKKYDSKKIGCLIQKLVGGNYWYVNPEYVEYVKPKNKNINFTVKSATISKTGKSIIIKGYIDGIECKLIYRTSDTSSKWPYRIFPEVSVPELIKKLT